MAHHTLAEVETAVEHVLAKELLHERMLVLPNEPERERTESALYAFESWAARYGVPATPPVFAAFLVELRKVHHANLDQLKFIAHAYLREHDRDVHVPVRAALSWCGGQYVDRQQVPTGAK
jgi:hypothetical protein